MMRIIWVLFLIILVVGLSPVRSQGEQPLEIPSANIVIGSRNLTTCLSALKQTSIQYEKTRKENDRLQSQWADCKANGITAIDKVGFVAVGALVTYTQFNPLSLVLAVYLILFQ